jgi:hypothetical protein
LIEKLAYFRERFVQFRLLRLRNPRIRHGPIGHEPAEKKAFREPQCLRAGKEQFFRLFDLLLSLSVGLIHQ